LNNFWLKIEVRCIRRENYTWGCTCSCRIHVVSKCSNSIILIMKRLDIFFGHIFLKMMRIPYKVYHLMYVTKLSCTCRKRIKWRRKQKKKKQKLDTRKVKRENKINIIIYIGIYLPDNDAKNLTRSKDWCLIPSAGVSK
jgi:hypothetical protein